MSRILASDVTDALIYSVGAGWNKKVKGVNFWYQRCNFHFKPFV